MTQETQLNIVTDSNGKQYKVLGLLHFDLQTPDKLCKIIHELHSIRAKVKIIYGGIETGEHWLEESDVYGTIGRSTGNIKIPLLVVHNSDGGGALMDNRILRIESDKKLFWQNPQMVIPEYKITASDMPEYAENLVIGGEIHARFKKIGSAKRLVSKLGLDLPSFENGYPIYK